MGLVDHVLLCHEDLSNSGMHGSVASQTRHRQSTEVLIRVKSLGLDELLLLTDLLFYCLLIIPVDPTIFSYYSDFFCRFLVLDQDLLVSMCNLERARLGHCPVREVLLGL